MTKLRNTLSALLVVGLAGGITAACDDDSTGPDEDAIIGTWVATSSLALGTDFIADGMSLTMTFEDGGTFSLSVENSQAGICDEDFTDCVESGSFTYTDTTLTLDPSTADETVFGYSIAGNTLTLSGMIDIVPVTLTATRQ